MTYGDGLETRVEDTTVEEGCTGVADDDGLGDEDDDGGEGGDEDVDFDVGVGVGVGWVRFEAITIAAAVR